MSEKVDLNVVDALYYPYPDVSRNRMILLYGKIPAMAAELREVRALLQRLVNLEDIGDLKYIVDEIAEAL